MTQYSSPAPVPVGFTWLPPDLASKIRRGSVVMGVYLLAVGIIFAAGSVFLAIAQESPHHASRTVLLSMGALPALLIIGVATGLLQVRGCVRQGYLDLARGRQVNAVLVFWWVVGMAAALVVTVLILVSNSGSTGPVTSALPTISVLLPVVDAALCNMGYFIGRSYLRPKLPR
jgi:hypothetical protein